MSECKTHIDKALSIVKQLIEFDFNAYSDLISIFCEGKDWISKENIQSFCDLYEWYSSDEEGQEERPIYFKKESFKLKFRRLNADDEPQKKWKSLYKFAEEYKIKEEVNNHPYLVSPEEQDSLKKLLTVDIIFDKIFKDSKGKIVLLGEEEKKTLFLNHLETRVKSSRNIISDLAYYCIKKREPIFNFLYNVNAELFYHLIKSFLNAEYLILDDFSKKVEEINTYFRSDEITKGNINPSTIIRLPYPIKSFVKIMWYAQELCSIIRISIKQEKDIEPQRILRIHVDKDTRFNSDAYFYKYQFYGNEQTIEFEKLMESVIEMTLIDHVYLTNTTNIENLKLLKKRIEVIFTLIDKGLINPEEEKKSNFERSLRMVNCKIEILLAGMLSSEYPSIKNNLVYIIDGKEKRPEDYSNIILKLKSFTSENPFVSIKNKYKRRVVKFEQFKKRDRYEDNIQGKSNRTDLTNYDISIEGSLVAFCKLSELYIMLGTNETHTSCKEIKEKIESLIEFKEHIRPSLYIHLIETLNERLDRIFNSPNAKASLNLIKDKVDLLRKQLGELYLYIKKRENYIPPQFRPYFAYSFCKVNDDTIIYGGYIPEQNIIDYNYIHFEDKFFFPSAGINPINLVHLESFRREFDNKRRNHTDRYLRSMIEENVDIFKVKIEDESRKLLGNTQQNIVTVLGVFASLIAFAAISLGAVKIVGNLMEYILFMLAFTTSLFILAMAVSPTPTSISEIETQSKNWCVILGKWFTRYIRYILCILLAASTIGFAIFYFSDKEKNISNENSTMIERNSHQIQVGSTEIKMETSKTIANPENK